jgi:hypothetical protein
MAYSLVLHISGEEALMGEVDELPKPADNVLILNNPRRRDGKDLHYLQANVVQAIWPMSKINFMEVLPTEEEEEIISFVRE